MTGGRLDYMAARSAARLLRMQGRPARWQMVIEGRPVGEPMDGDESRVALIEAQAAWLLRRAGWPADRAADAVAEVLEAGAPLRLDRVAEAARLALCRATPHGVRT